MKTLFVGIKSCGKGTQAKLLSKKLNIPHISSGDIFRGIDTSSPLGKKIRSYIDNGNYVPDDLVIELVSKELSKDKYKNGFILDGFPRTIAQAKAFNKKHKFNHIIYIKISKKEGVHRASGRWTCSNKKCGAIYNVNTSPKPKVVGICDKCGAKLYQRKDETKEATTKRINKDIKELNPMLELYKNQNIAIEINGEKSIEEVHKEILDKLKINK